MKNNTNIEISVIIPFYNEINLIDRAVESVFEQVGNDFIIELIIVNDGYLNEIDISNVIKRKNINVTKNIYGKGPGGARNTGLDLASGCFIAFLDADDYWSSGKLNKQLKVFSLGYNFVCTAYKFEGRNTLVKPPNNIKKAIDVFLKQGIGTSSVMISKEILGDTRFNDYRFSQDIDFWYRIASKKNFSFYSIDDPLVTYYTGGTTKNKIVQAKYFYHILNRNNVHFFNKIYILLRYFVRGVFNYYIR
mgnify:CR=1 FL=1